MYRRHSIFSIIFLRHLVLFHIFLICFLFSSPFSGFQWRAEAWTAPGSLTVMLIPPSSLRPHTDVWEKLYENSAKEASVLLTLPVDSHHVFLVDAKDGSPPPYSSSSPSSTSHWAPMGEVENEMMNNTQNHDHNGSGGDGDSLSDRAIKRILHPHQKNSTSLNSHKKREKYEEEEEEEETWAFRHRIAALNIRADHVALAAAAAAAPRDASLNAEMGNLEEPRASVRPPLPIPTFLLHPFPFISNVSDTWEVVVDDAGPVERLLHCRIPYTKSPSLVKEEEDNLIAAHESAMSTSLQVWWEEMVLPREGEGLHGNGDIFPEGPWKWYILCPFDGFYRVHSELLRAALTPTHPTIRSRRRGSEEEEEEEAEEELDRQELQKKKEEYLHRWKTCQAEAFHSHFNGAQEKFNSRDKEAEEQTLFSTTAAAGGGWEEKNPHYRWSSSLASREASLSLLEEKYVNDHSRSEWKKSGFRTSTQEKGMEEQKQKKTKKPGRLVRRRETANATASTARSQGRKKEDEKRRENEMDALVRSFENEQLRCSPSFNALLQGDANPLLKIAVTKVGEYRPQGNSGEDRTSTSRERERSDGRNMRSNDSKNSRPQWNSDLRAFEMWYPSSTPCMNDKNVSSIYTSPPPDASPMEYWSTRFVFRCRNGRGSTFAVRGDPPQPGSPPHHKHPGGLHANPPFSTSSSHNYNFRNDFPFLNHRGGGGVDEDMVEENGGGLWGIQWSISELRQKCVIEVEISSSELVCLWDSFLDQVRLNPIPCVEIQ